VKSSIFWSPPFRIQLTESQNMTRNFNRDRHRETMRKVPSRNSKHEVLLRDFLDSEGFVDETENTDLPFLPDIVLPDAKIAVFMHGCLWHRHPNCRFAYDVNPRVKHIEQWLKKFADNQARDQRQTAELLAMGWRVLVVWQCALNAKKRANIFLPLVLEWIRGKDSIGEIPQEPPVLKH
jgi:DNA mismatch endonuclease, patch repair protein